MKYNTIYIQMAFKIVGNTQSENKLSTAWEQEQPNHYFHFELIISILGLMIKL
jgi:hypothetical protein